MNVTEIRQALKRALLEVDGVRPFDYPVEEPPAGQGDVVVVMDGAALVEYQQAFANGLATVNLVLRIYIQASDIRTAYLRRDALLSSGTGEARSIVDAVMFDRTLGGIGNVVVDQSEGVELDTTFGGIRYLVTDLALRVLVGRL
jgi:hypothetical protein